MTDRELLELAAKAYWGDEIDDVVSIDWSEEDGCIAFTHADNQDHNGLDVAMLWNPLNDAGDALRLVVKLRMQIIPGTYNEVEATAYARAGAEEAHEYVHYQQDLLAATRRAIVRAAAELGRSMP